jgi:hypothetical protein
LSRSAPPDDVPAGSLVLPVSDSLAPVIDRRLLLSDFDSVAARLETKGVRRAELEAARSGLEAHRSRLQQLEAKRAESRSTAERIKAAGGPPDEQTLVVALSAALGEALEPLGEPRPAS